MAGSEALRLAHLRDENTVAAIFILEPPIVISTG
jgi:hypothetical protein